MASSRKEAEEMYALWVEICKESGLSEFDDFIKTVANWHEEIFAYFDFTGDNRTNAQTESFNRMIRDIDRNGRGYKFEVLRAKVLFGGATPKRGGFDWKKFDEDKKEGNKDAS